MFSVFLGGCRAILYVHLRSETLFLRTCISLRGCIIFLIFMSSENRRGSTVPWRSATTLNLNAHTQDLCIFSGT